MIFGMSWKSLFDITVKRFLARKNPRESITSRPNINYMACKCNVVVHLVEVQYIKYGPSIRYNAIRTNLICYCVQEEVIRYKKLHDDILIERNKFKQQCTQVREDDIALWALTDQDVYCTNSFVIEQLYRMLIFMYSLFYAVNKSAILITVYWNR
jgi:hypothetical protein